MSLALRDIKESQGFLGQNAVLKGILGQQMQDLVSGTVIYNWVKFSHHLISSGITQY